MAMELYKENPSPLGIMSPRISFSHDISPSDIINFPVEQSLLRSIPSSSPEFDFCNHHSFNQHSVSAEDIFHDGKLLPTDKPKPKSKPQQPPAPVPPSLNHSHPPELKPDKKSLESQRSNDTPGCCDHQSEDQKKKSKSFWQFKRSSSLNSGNSYARSLCPIPLLSRSNSAGSATTSKRSSSSKESHNLNKQHAQKSSSVSTSTKQSQLSSSNSYQKPPLKKNGYGGNTSYGSSSSHGNGVRINPVLNVPSANLFGLGSIFSTSSNKQEKSTKFKS
ncbi:Nucleoporin like [Heracleum sosnowskyi]|uniref:Nucleoporin like n=1 Tax=Heracleum sosnowskyi TaxID=360622 RepID=A0AAD8M2U7_9APIA|nr:Nucleoporin like [Heracleum sosnowskyi]